MVLAILGTYVTSAVNKDVVSGIEVVNPGGSKTALVVYQAGLTSFPRDTSMRSGAGLQRVGGGVEVTTAGPQAIQSLEVQPPGVGFSGLWGRTREGHRSLR